MPLSMLSPADVAGLIRRVRRIADLSQRELADKMGVDQSTVARWEAGNSVPDVLQFVRTMQVAGLSVDVLDSDGQPAVPMSDAAPLDRQRRRYPAHLDLVDEPNPVVAGYRLTAPRRQRRDRLRARQGWSVPNDHPSSADVDESRRLRREERRTLMVARARARRAARGWRDSPPCSCPMGCEERAGCLSSCVCQCET